MKKIITAVLALCLAGAIVLPTFAATAEEDLIARLGESVTLADGSSFNIWEDAGSAGANLAAAQAVLDSKELTAAQISQIDALITQAQQTIAGYTHDQLAGSAHDSVNAACYNLAVQAANIAGVAISPVQNTKGEWEVTVISYSSTGSAGVIKNTGAQD